jgi:hypothetical protein
MYFYGAHYGFVFFYFFKTGYESITRSSGYENSMVSFLRNLSPKIKVRDPILPINMVAIINNLPSSDNFWLPLSEYPTLLNAETVSKNISKKLQEASVNNKQNVVNKIQPSPSDIIAIALYI